MPDYDVRLNFDVRISAETELQAEQYAQQIAEELDYSPPTSAPWAQSWHPPEVSVEFVVEDPE